MARDLNYTISEVFRGESTTRGVSYWGRNQLCDNSSRVYMDIPINTSIFEVPTFALSTFFDMLDRKKFEEDAIVAVLKTLDRTPRYKTLNRYMRDVLLEDFRIDRLVKMEIPGEGDTPLIYYATCGMILNSEFTPIMMCSWQIKRDVVEDGSYLYEFLRPIMRINPSCYLCREDSMERFIANKLPLVALDTHIYEPYSRHVPECFCQRSSNLSVDLRIEIDKCPFVLRRSDAPSISTTNKKLLQIAIDHIDELIQ